MSDKSTETDNLLVEWFELFTRVHRWIEIVLNVQLPPDPFLFVEGLQDGIVLCFLSKAIDSRSIPRIQEDKTATFRLRENIMFFLAACQDFGIPKIRIFSAADLSGKRVVRVVDTLAALAERATKPAPEGIGFKPELPPLKTKLDMNAIKSQYAEATIKELSKQVVPLKPVARKGGNRTSVLVARTQIKLMTGEGSFPKFEKGMTKLQAMWRGYQQRLAFQAMVRDQAFRDNVAMEIKQTEKDYAAQLETCITVFLEPLEKAAEEDEKSAPMTKDQIEKIFMNVRDIYAFHKDFAKSLEERVGESWSASKCIGDVFLELTKVTPAYSDFAQKYPQSIDELDSLRGNKACDAFLLSCKSKSRLDLPSLLITPIQRIPRYNLLLLEYNKHTWESHRDKPMLKKAIETVKSMAETINATKSRVESERRLKQLYESIKGIPPSVLKPGRVIVTEASFTDKHHDPVALVLFKDALLWYKPGGLRKEFKFKDCMDLWCLEITQKDRNDSTFDVLRSGKTILTLSSKDPSVAIGFVRIWNDTKKLYEDGRARARREESNIVRQRRNSAVPPDASNVLVGRNNRGLQKDGKYYGKMTEEERKDVIQGLHIQHIAVQQQLFSLDKVKMKSKEREALRTSLNEQMDEIMARLAELGATPAHAATIQIPHPTSGAAAATQNPTKTLKMPMPGRSASSSPSISSSSSPSTSPSASPELPPEKLKKPEATEKKGFGLHSLFRRGHGRRLSDSAVQKPEDVTDSPRQTESSAPTSPTVDKDKDPQKPAVQGDATTTGKPQSTTSLRTPTTTPRTRPTSYSTSLVVTEASSSGPGSVQDRIRKINAAARAAAAIASSSSSSGSSTPGSERNKK